MSALFLAASNDFYRLILSRAYGPPAGSGKDNPFGNPRPFQTEPHFIEYTGTDFCGAETTNTAYLQNLAANPAYPSGHTTYGYMESLLLALLVPERYQQMVTRAAEYGNDRIVLGPITRWTCWPVGRLPNTTSPSYWPTRRATSA